MWMLDTRLWVCSQEDPEIAAHGCSHQTPTNIGDRPRNDPKRFQTPEKETFHYCTNYQQGSQDAGNAVADVPHIGVGEVVEEKAAEK